MGIVVDTEKCTGCGICKDACTVDAIIMQDGKAYITLDCVEYGSCIEVCPEQAISREVEEE